MKKQLMTVLFGSVLVLGACGGGEEEPEMEQETDVMPGEEQGDSEDNEDNDEEDEED